VKTQEKVLIVQHSEDDPPGSLLEWLDSKAIPYSIHHANLNTDYPDCRSWTWLIILGGAPNVDQEKRYPWLVAEKKFIRQALDSHQKILGLCLGAQLIADQLGASVHRHDQWEVGWHKVSIDSTHPLFKDSPAEIEVFQYHAYRFHLPSGAQRISANSICDDQAYVYGDRVVGFQFHPEATTVWMKECLSSLSDDRDIAGPAVQSPLQIAEQMGKQVQLQSWFFNFLNRFLNA